MQPTRIYLDNNATTRMDPRVAAAMNAIFSQKLANPASQHHEGRNARFVLESSRTSIAKGLGCRTQGMGADQVLFTSGGTEANNLAIFGLLEGIEGDLVVSAIEHPSVLGAADEIAKRGNRRVRYLPVDVQGRASIATWNHWLSEHREAVALGQIERRIGLVSLMIANNETGVLQPVDEIIHSAHSNGILVHTDAVQAIGKIPIRFESLNVDAMTVTAHKLHGPVGVGALILKEHLAPSPQLYGGFQQLGMRPGTESVVLAAGFSTAVQIAIENIDHRNNQLKLLRQQFEDLLFANPRRPTIVSSDVPRMPHTISLAYPGIERQVLQMALDREGIACSTGSACASGSGQPSHVLQAMGVAEPILRGAIRLSLSVETTQDEIIDAAKRISRAANRFPV